MTKFAESLRRRRHLAWGVPVVVAGAVAGTVALASMSASAASPTLPTRTATQLLAAVQGSATTTFSGTVSETADLGIPALPGGKSSASLSWQTFVSGTHSARVWSDGPTKQRLALIGELSEADVVHNGRDLWTYTSDTNTVTHSTLSADSADSPDQPAPAEQATPTALAARLLKAITPSTAVTVGSTETVAGRSAYTLVLRPRDAHATVSKVVIAIDATKWLPLRVQVFAGGSSPALSAGFSSITYGAPAASIFAFTPPKGATVATDPLGLRGGLGGGHHRFGHHRPAPSAAHPTPTPGSSAPQAGDRPTVLGSGWTSVLELRDSGGVLDSSTFKDLTSAVGSDGTRLLHTALINAVIEPDGRTFIGAVSPSFLEHLAATTH